MTSDWTYEEINSILRDLNKMGLPFERYVFTESEGSFVSLGSGASGYVFEAEKKRGRGRYAIKVIGFNSVKTDVSSFRAMVKNQKTAAGKDKNAVKIYDSVSILVQFGEDMKVEDAEPVTSDVMLRDNSIILHFLLMEHLTPVIEHTSLGKVRVIPKTLQDLPEEEAVKLAYEVGKAVENLHASGIIHKDIKLENILYSEKNKRYKLGDFDMSDNDSSGKAVFTKGYGAPEIVGKEFDKYEATADIYSLGVTLYLLLNDLCFPGSNEYRVNLKDQYSDGFVFQKPAGVSDGLFDIIAKMCSFNPEDRYQTISEVINDLEAPRFGNVMKARRNDRKGSLVFGMFLAFIGGMLLPMGFSYASARIETNVIIYIMFGFCFLKALLRAFDRKLIPNILTVLSLALGVADIVLNGFIWWKPVLYLAMCYYTSFGGMASSLLAGRELCLLSDSSLIQTPVHLEWICVLFFFFALSFAIQYESLSVRRERINRRFHGRMAIFARLVFGYPLMVVIGILFAIKKSPPSRLAVMLGGEELLTVVQYCRLWLVGLLGAALHVLFIIRSYVGMKWDE